MSKAPENTLEIIEKNIKALRDQIDPLSLPDVRRLEMLVNIRRVIIANGTETIHVIHKNAHIPDDEILAVLSKPELPIKIPRKRVAKKLPKKKAK